MNESYDIVILIQRTLVFFSVMLYNINMSYLRHGGRLLLTRGGDLVYLTLSDLLGLGMFVIALIALIEDIRH